MVPRAGLEPARRYRQRILGRLELQFCAKFNSLKIVEACVSIIDPVEEDLPYDRIAVCLGSHEPQSLGETTVDVVFSKLKSK